MAHHDGTVPQPAQAPLVGEAPSTWVFGDAWCAWIARQPDIVWREPAAAELRRPPLYAMLSLHRNALVPALSRLLYRQGWGHVPEGILGYVSDYASWTCAAAEVVHHCTALAQDCGDFPHACGRCHQLLCCAAPRRLRACAVCVMPLCPPCARAAHTDRCRACDCTLVFCPQHTAPLPACACPGALPYQLCRTCCWRTAPVCSRCDTGRCGCRTETKCVMRTPHRDANYGLRLGDDGPFSRLKWDTAYRLTHTSSK